MVRINCASYLLLLSWKYRGSFILQLGQGFFLPCFSKHFLQSSLPHFLCCLGSSATPKQITHSRALTGSARKLYLYPSVSQEAISTLIHIIMESYLMIHRSVWPPSQPQPTCGYSTSSLLEILLVDMSIMHGRIEVWILSLPTSSLDQQPWSAANSLDQQPWPTALINSLDKQPWPATLISSGHDQPNIFPRWIDGKWHQPVPLVTLSLFVKMERFPHSGPSLTLYLT